MESIIKTIYQNGVFKPLNKVKLPENTKIELVALRDFSFGSAPKDILAHFIYAKGVFKKSRKLPSGLAYQRKLRRESDHKVCLRLKNLNA